MMMDDNTDKTMLEQLGYAAKLEIHLADALYDLGYIYGQVDEFLQPDHKAGPLENRLMMTGVVGYMMMTGVVGYIRAHLPYLLNPRGSKSGFTKRYKSKMQEEVLRGEMDGRRLVHSIERAVVEEARDADR